MVKLDKCCISTKDGAIGRSVREEVRIIDAIKSENNYLLEKFPEHYNLIDKEARNVFSKRLTAAALKCSLVFNMHGTMHCAINEHVVD